MDLFQLNEFETLTTKKAVEFLLNDTLRLKVCRYCLKVCSNLSELDEILEIGIDGGLHEVTIHDMMASFYPYKVEAKACFPNKICEECLNSVMKAYLFTQQCERAERAIRNLFEDVQEKCDKLDPLEPIKKRGKRKLNPNTNIIYVEKDKVIDYAKPIINIVNTSSVLVHDVEVNVLECQKCWQVQPSPQALVLHEESHPKSLWYNCKVCGKSFVKRYHLKQHIKKTHNTKGIEEIQPNSFSCTKCGENNTNLGLHYQHMEKHKFKTMLCNIINRKVDRLCVLCLEDGTKMTHLNEIIDLHGGYPELNGEFTIKNILSDVFLSQTEIKRQAYKSLFNAKDIMIPVKRIKLTLPDKKMIVYTNKRSEMQDIKLCKICWIFNKPCICVKEIKANCSYCWLFINIPFMNVGKKVCKTCLNHALNSYIFTCKLEHVKNRLNKCVTAVYKSLNSIKYVKSTMMIEISNDIILPAVDLDTREEPEQEIEVLEDEFREEIEEESSSESEEENPVKIVTNTHSRHNLVNGYNSLNNINEFLMFKPKVTEKIISKCYFTCLICNKYFISDYFLKKHVLKHAYKVEECKKCNKQCKSRFDLFEHTKMVHVLKKFNYFSCDLCDRSYTSINKLKQHKRSHIRKECHLCNKYFKNQIDFVMHIQRHIARYTLYNKGKNTCSFCEKSYPNKNELSLHVNKIHFQMKPYSCDMCEKSYYTEYNLNSHKKLHSLYSKEDCTFCRKTFKCRKSLVIHVRKHIGIKPHKCPLCIETYYSECSMKKHMNKMHGGKFLCIICKVTYRSAYNLRLHTSIAHSI